MRIPVSNKYIITCPFGKKGKLWKAGYHTGIDLVTSDKKVYSSCNGFIYAMGIDKSYGNYIVIKDMNNYHHWFCHLSKNLLIEARKVGEKVNEGDIIGIMGKTGNVTGIHLHYEIRKECNCYGQVANPLEYIKIFSIKTYNLLKVVFTGALEENRALVACIRYNIETKEYYEYQFWAEISHLNALKETLQIKDTGARDNDNILIEIESKEQIWVNKGILK